MTINQLTVKQIAEMQDLIELQDKEVEAMMRRHDRERQGNASAYFEQRREKQLSDLKKRHVLERDRLAVIHEKEYQDMRVTRSIIHGAEQVEKKEENYLNRQMKQRNAEEEPKEEKSILETIRELVQRKQKTKDRKQEL